MQQITSPVSNKLTKLVFFTILRKDKDNDKEEYELPLERENFPMAERKFKGRNSEGSFGIGRLNEVDLHGSSPL